MPSVLAVEAIQVGPRNLRRLGKSQHEDYAIAAVGVSVFALLSIAWSRAVFHWFLMPVGACGILAGVDVVRWLRGRLDVFDPKTVVGCLAFYGFFAAPILHVIWDIYGVGNEMLLWGDWRPWLGAMASLNALGLVAYRCAHNWMFNRAAPSSIRWNLDRKKFYPVFASALAASVIGVAIYLWELGGISGVVDAYENNPEAFVGKGWLLVLAWPLAVLSFIVIVHAWTDRHKTHRPRLATGIIFLSISGIGHFLLLGWYGSRGTTIWALFWMAGIVHYHFRKLSRGIVTVGLILLVVFMYFYGFYKEQKRESFEILRSPALWWEPPGYQRDLKHLLLGDLARADSNALILHNLIKDPGDYDYRWGLTYLGAFGILIPRNIWTDRPEFKVDAGTEAQQGKAEVQAGLGQGGPHGQRRAIALRRQGQPPLPLEGDAEVVEGLGMIRTEGKDLVVAGDSLVHAAQALVGHAPIEPDIGQAGVEPDQRRVLLDRRPVRLLVQEYAGQGVVRLEA